MTIKKVMETERELLLKITHTDSEIKQAKLKQSL